MNWIIVMVFSLFILLGYEIRYRVASEELEKLKTEINDMEKEILRLSQEMKLKKNIYEEHKPGL